MSQGLRVDIEVKLPAFGLRAAFDVPPGLTVLFGPSGAGKSLTLQAIAGLVAPERGRIVLGGQTVLDTAQRLALPPRGRRIGYVPQQYALFPHLSVAQNVAYALPRRLPPWDRVAAERRARRVAELLALVRLPGFEDRRPRELSGGQAQRVALARALAAQPRALLLDEPLGALDAPTRAAVRDDLRAVVVESGVPAIVVTHDLAEARALGDRLVVLTNGTVAAAGPIADVLASPTTDEAALLLGWRNVLAVAEVARDGARAEVTVAGGQRVLAEAGDIGRAASGARPGRALALHADRLELRRDELVGGHEETTAEASSGAIQGRRGDPEAGRTVRGAVVGVEDAGAFYVVRVALIAGAAGGNPGAELVATCSPREWALLGATVGERVVAHVPAGAARLVRRHMADASGVRGEAGDGER
jgi:molybdate transport system ATP-binding protein